MLVAAAAAAATAGGAPIHWAHLLEQQCRCRSIYISSVPIQGSRKLLCRETGKGLAQSSQGGRIGRHPINQHELADYNSEA